jgi:hypothetical protein
MVWLVELETIWSQDSLESDFFYCLQMYVSYCHNHHHYSRHHSRRLRGFVKSFLLKCSFLLCSLFFSFS